MTNQYADWSPDFIGGYSQKRPQSASILEATQSAPLDPTTTMTTTSQFIDPSSVPLPRDPITWPFQFGEQAQQVGQGFAGGVLDVFGRLIGPQTSPFTGSNLQPYSPMFNPESFWGQLGRGVVSGTTGGYPEGPVDHRSLSPVDQALMFSDLVDPSGAAGDVVRAGVRAIPEDTLAAVAGVMPLNARQLLTGSKVVDVEGNPQRVYHGTQGVFIDPSPEYSDSGALLGRGMYYTENPVIAGGGPEAAGYADTKVHVDLTGKASEARPNVHADYLNLQKPLYLERGRKKDVVDKMSDEIFSFASWNRSDGARAETLKAFSQNLYNQSGTQAFDPDDFLDDIGLNANAIDEYIDTKQWDKAEADLRKWFMEVTDTNQDTRDVVTNFFRYNQDPSLRWGNDVWTDGIMELGYDGMSHIGQGGWQQGGLKHRVWVVLADESTGTPTYEGRIFPSASLEGMAPPPPRGEMAEMLSNISEVMPPQGTGGVLP